MTLLRLPLLLAAGAAPPFFAEAAILIVASAVVAYGCYRLGLMPIVGFLIAGVLIGPNALGLVEDQELIDAAAEIGVILLLFTIGIEFSLEKLGRIKALIFGGGGLQVGLTTAIVAGLLMLFGVGWQVGVFTGFLVALSSTAIVLKLLTSRGEMNTEPGQVSLGLLIFQDLAIVLMVLLVPMLAGQGGSALELATALGTALGIIALVLVVARRVMPPVLEAVARTCSPELFLLSVIAICFGTAWLTSLAGVSLSLGAFLAGLVVSESRFSEHAFGEILPLQILFSAAFFVSVGMLLDVGYLAANIGYVLAAIAAALVLKVVTTSLSALALGYPLKTAAASGLMLAQVGEFSFVLERAGREVGLSPAGLGEAGVQTFIAATVLLMIGTPSLAQAGAALSAWLGRRAEEEAAEKAEAAPLSDEHTDLENHVIVAGYGQTARRLVRVLRSSGLPFVITTLNPGAANEAEAAGLPVLRADAARQRTLQHVGAERAKMMVVADDAPAMAERITAVGRVTNPTMRIAVAARYLPDAERLHEAGADRVVVEELERALGVFDDVLHAYGLSPTEIEAQEAVIRSGDYALLRAADRQQALALTLAPDGLSTRTVTLREGMAVAGQSLKELDLRRRHALTVRRVRRGEEVLADPPGDFVFQPGDELLLAGSADRFAESAPLFRLPTDGGDGAPSGSGAPSGDGLPPAFGAAPPPPTDRDVTTLDVDQTVRLDDAQLQSPDCGHTDQARAVSPSTPGCEECLQRGDDWVHLRICMTCGHVGCCDSSKNKHASKHAAATEHPIVKSVEPGEDWGWCYVDETML